MVSRWDGPIYRIDVLYLVQDGYTQGARLYRRLDQTADGIPCQVGTAYRYNLVYTVWRKKNYRCIYSISWLWISNRAGWHCTVRALEAANG